MSVFLKFVKGVEWIKRRYRRKVVKKSIGCKHNNFKILGELTLYNTNIKMGNNVIIYPNCTFFGEGKIEIGDNVAIGNDTMIYASAKGGGIHIGNDTSIAAHCYIIDSDHGISANELISKQKSKVEPIYIGNDCWLASNVTVLKGSKINDGAVIGAKALVKGEIPKNAIAVGIPAKVKSYRK